ncbi:NAD(P)/FAD-dependent oxidoreductase [Sphingomonas colocasiae]|uniref:FAD-dependent monooxygenase n=1 Tax=Sphingomonas colocasiae TaxID=1848973 RepID=A0ABS7PUI4_9SPHN|nr:FAD-dependent monooxygenase [Sphingomonas colocasiae]MBY8824629.1 FAD-dependent monooxygenase [Sphingomonas colocasiae]
MRRTAALIAGGGPAGAATAIMLARAGHAALVIERHRETGDALCGGFLSWRTRDTLDRLGIDRTTLSGHAIARVRVFANGRTGEARLPGEAIGVSRRRLDGMLLARAEAMGGAIERGVAIRSAAPGSVELADGATIACEALFLATGKHDCRGLARPRPQGDPALGLRRRIAPAPQLSRLVGDAIELHLFRGGYAGLLLQEDGSANLCMAVRKSRLAEAGGDPERLMVMLAAESPALAERLAHAGGTAAFDAIGSVPYGWRARDTEPGIFRLGDQAAVIPSLAGEGVGIALTSGMMAAAHWLREGAANSADFQRILATRTARPVRIAGLVAAAADTRIGRPAGPIAIAVMPGLAALLAYATRIAAAPLTARADGTR